MVLNISPRILIEKISKLIGNPLNKKALGLDSVLNKVFKVVTLIIIKDLAKTASYYLTSEIILKRLKKFIIIVLRKKFFFTFS